MKAPALALAFVLCAGPTEEAPLSALEPALLRRLEGLPQATFRPTFFQFTAALAVKF